MIAYKVSAHLNGELHSCTLTLPGYYAVSGLSETEAEMLVDNTENAYDEFYGDHVDNEDVTAAAWEEVNIEFAGVDL